MIRKGNEKKREMRRKDAPRDTEKHKDTETPRDT